MGSFLKNTAKDWSNLLEALVVTIVVVATVGALAATLPKKPHLLVGYGCEGSNGQPMYYTEESDFPPCSLIESAR